MSHRGDGHLAEWRGGDTEMDAIAELTEEEGVAGPIMEQTFREKTESWWNLAYQQPAHRGMDATDGKDKTSAVHISSRTSNRVFNSRTQDMWDLSESVMELYESCQRRENLRSLRRDARDMIEKQESVDVQSWLAQSDETGFIRIFFPLDGPKFQHSRLIPCTVETTAQQICRILGISVSALHVQLNGDIIERVDSEQMPLLLQNNYLMTLGYESITKVKEEGLKPDLGFLIRFYAGKPGYEGTFSRNQLNAWLEVRKGKVMQQWVHRMCVLYGTRLLLYKDKARRSDPSTLQLARGIVEQAKVKGRDLCLKLTSTLDKVKIVYLSFHDQREYEKWYTRCKKATDKLPTSADLSNCHLEFMPDNIFVNDQLSILNLRHNVLRERPSEAAQFPITIGWLDDLTRFTRLRSLNLADNGLEHFPSALCALTLLAELNLASNKLTEVPPAIGNLVNLRALHLHNNHLASLPEEMLALKKLFVLVLAFNRFASIPPVVAAMTDIRHSEMDKLILAGNQVSTLSESVLASMKYVKKLDLRLNLLTLLPSETARLALVERLTHLDVRDNCISEELDLRCLAQLSYLNCERNNIMSLQLTGTALKTLLVAQNSLERLGVNPQPEQLIQLDVSDNFLQALPDWLDECSCLQVLKASNNQLIDVPQRLFCDLKKLRILHLDHNFIEALPREIDTIFIEEIYLHSNYLTSLPPDFLRKANKLRVLNLSKNCLASLPPPAETMELNKLRELYLALNCLSDNCMDTIAAYTRLRVLHLAYNELHTLHNKDVKQFGMLEELNLSANQLQSLPSVIGELPKLSVLRAHSNYLTSLPDLTKAVALRALDVGHNNLLNISFSSLFNSQLYLLDMSMNKQLRVDPKEFKTIKHSKKSVLLVDTTGQGRSLPGLKRHEAPPPAEEDQTDNMPWKVGFAETAGSRNKLCVKLLKLVRFRSDNEALFGMFDGGYNDEVPKLLVEKMPQIVAEEIEHADTALEYMKYSFLSAHRQLRVSGQRLGASSALCHLKRLDGNSKKFSLQIANVGDVEAVLCRQDDAVVLTRKFTTTDNREECYRVCLSDGIIMEDGRVEGLSKCTRQIGAAFLYPHSVPEPFVCEVQLHHDDEFLIIASRTVWSHLSYGEAVEAIYEIGSPVIAAKKIQDLVQAYGCQENVAVMVIRFNTERGPTLARLRPVPRPMSVDDVEAAAQFDAARRRRQMKQRAQATRAIPEERHHPPVDSQVNVSHDVYQLDSNQTLTTSSQVRGGESGSLVRVPVANVSTQQSHQEHSAALRNRPAAVAGQDVIDGPSLAAKAKKEHRNLEVMKTAGAARPRINHDNSGEGDAGSMYSRTLPANNNSHVESDAASSFTAGLSEPKGSLTKGYTSHTLHVDSSDVIAPVLPVYAARVTHSDASFAAGVDTHAASSLSFVAASSLTNYPASTFSEGADQPYGNYSSGIVPSNAYTASDVIIEEASFSGISVAAPDQAMWASAAYSLPSKSEASSAASSQPISYLPNASIERKDVLRYSDVDQEASVPSLLVPNQPPANNESDNFLTASAVSSLRKSSAASLPRSSNNSIAAGTRPASGVAYKSPVSPAVLPKGNSGVPRTKEVSAKNLPPPPDESMTAVPFNVVLKPLSTHRFVRRDDVNRWNNLLQGNRSDDIKSVEHRQVENESRVNADKPALAPSNKFASGSVSRGTSQGFLQYMHQQSANQQQPAIVVSPPVSRHAIGRQASEEETDSALLNVKATIHLFEHITSRESLNKLDDAAVDDNSAQALLAKPPTAATSKRAKSETRDPQQTTGNSNTAASLLHRSPSDHDGHLYQQNRGRYLSNSRTTTPLPEMHSKGDKPIIVAAHSRSQSNVEPQVYASASASAPSYARQGSVKASATGKHEANNPSPNTIRGQIEARSRVSSGGPPSAAAATITSRRPPSYPPPPLPESTSRPPSAMGPIAAASPPSLAFHYEQLHYDSRSGDNMLAATESDNSINATQQQQVYGGVQTKPRGNVEVRAAASIVNTASFQPQPPAGVSSDAYFNRNRRPSQPVQSSAVQNNAEYASIRRRDASADGQSSSVKAAVGDRSMYDAKLAPRSLSEKTTVGNSYVPPSSTLSSERSITNSSSENSIGRMGKPNIPATTNNRPGTSSVGRSRVPNSETEELYSTVNKVRRRMDSANFAGQDETKRFNNTSSNNGRYSGGNEAVEYGADKSRSLRPASQPAVSRNVRDIASYNQPRQYAPLPLTNSNEDDSEFVEQFSRL